MKKSIILFYFFLISSSFLFGQKQLGYLIKGGLNYSNITNYALENKPILGYNLGVATEILIYDKISIQPEIQFSAQGWLDLVKLRLNFDDPSIIKKIRIQLNYINIPILLKYNISKTFSINAGPQIGYLISTQSNSSEVQINNDSFNKTDISFSIGTGLKIESFLIDLRYNLGLTDLSKSFNSKNSVLQLAMGYKFL